MNAKTETIRRLNDEIRTGQSTDGRTVITSGVQALGTDALTRLHTAITQFDVFTEDNDPYGEHDFGSLDFEGNRIFWKIDYYSKSLEGGSEDPSNPDCTTRVLTIMLAEEY